MSNNEMPHEDMINICVPCTKMDLLKDNFEAWKKLVSNGQHVCGGCGRVAHSSENLCDPQNL